MAYPTTRSFTEPYVKEVVTVTTGKHLRVILYDADDPYWDEREEAGVDILLLEDEDGDFIARDAGKSRVDMYYDSDKDYYFFPSGEPQSASARRIAYNIDYAQHYVDRVNAFDETKWTVTGPDGVITWDRFAFQSFTRTWNSAGRDPNTGAHRSYGRDKHYIDFILPDYLEEGGTYVFQNTTLGCTVTLANFSYKNIRAEAIKTNQVGWRPDDTDIFAIWGVRDRLFRSDDAGPETMTFQLLNELNTPVTNHLPITLQSERGNYRWDNVNPANFRPFADTVKEPWTIVDFLPGDKDTNWVQLSGAYANADDEIDVGDFIFMAGVSDALTDRAQINGALSLIGYEVLAKLGSNKFRLRIYSYLHNAGDIDLPADLLDIDYLPYKGRVWKVYSGDDCDTTTYKLLLTEDLPVNRYRFYIEQLGCSDPFDLDWDVYERQRIEQEHGYIPAFMGMPMTEAEVGYDRKSGDFGYDTDEHPIHRTNMLVETSGEVTSNVFPSATGFVPASPGAQGFGTCSNIERLVGANIRSTSDAGDHDWGIAEHGVGNARMAQDYLAFWDFFGQSALESQTKVWPRMSDKYDSSWSTIDDMNDLGVKVLFMAENMKRTQITDSGSPGYRSVLGGFSPWAGGGGIGGGGSNLGPNCATDIVIDFYKRGATYAAGHHSLLIAAINQYLASVVLRTYDETKADESMASGDLIFDLVEDILTTGPTHTYYVDHLKMYEIGVPNLNAMFDIASADASTNRITATKLAASTFTNGQRIHLSDFSADDGIVGQRPVPGGLQCAKAYYVHNISNDGTNYVMTLHSTQSGGVSGSADIVDITSSTSTTGPRMTGDEGDAYFEALFDKLTYDINYWGTKTWARCAKALAHSEAGEDMSALIADLENDEATDGLTSSPAIGSTLGYGQDSLVLYMMLPGYNETFVNSQITNNHLVTNDNARYSNIAENDIIPYPRAYNIRWNWAYGDGQQVAKSIALGTTERAYKYHNVQNSFFRGRNQFNLAWYNGEGSRSMESVLFTDVQGRNLRDRGIPKYVEVYSWVADSFTSGPPFSNNSTMYWTAVANDYGQIGVLGAPIDTWVPGPTCGEPKSLRWSPHPGLVDGSEFQIATNVQSGFGPIQFLHFRHRADTEEPNTATAPSQKYYVLRGTA